MFHNSSGKFC